MVYMSCTTLEGPGQCGITTARINGHSSLRFFLAVTVMGVQFSLTKATKD